MTKSEINSKVYRLQNIRLILDPGHVAVSRQLLVKKETPKGVKTYYQLKYTTKER